MSPPPLINPGDNVNRSSAESQVFEKTSEASGYWAWLFLAAAVLLAWLGELQHYLRVADDFPFAQDFERGLWKHIGEIYSQKGIRRSLGFVFNVPICGTPEWLTGWLCVALHLVATLCFFGTAKRLTRSTPIALLLAICFGVFPGGYGAIVWAAGTYVIPHVLFFLLNLWLLLWHGEKHKLSDWQVGVISFSLTLLCCVGGEHLIFASMISGALAYFATKPEMEQFSVSATFRRPWIWVPTVTCMLYLALAIITQPGSAVPGNAAGSFDPHHVNPRTLFSVWVYQYRYIDMLQPWFRRGAFSVAFQTWGLGRWVTALGLLVAAAWLLPRAYRNGRGTCFSRTTPWAVDVCFIGMMFSLSAVHMLAGGYSASSRHQYVPLALGLLFVGWLMVRLSRSRINRLLLARDTARAVLTIAVGTTWLVSGINRFELQRHHVLVDFLTEEDINGRVRVTYDPVLYYYWPRMARTISNGFDQTWVINLALEYAGKDPVELTESVSAPVVSVKWDGARFQASRIKFRPPDLAQ